MTPLSSGDSLGVAGASVPGPLGFGVSGGGGADPDPLGFDGASYGVSDRSWVMFRSMELSSHSSSCCCWLDAIWWLVPEPLTVVKGLNPLDPSVNQPRSVVGMRRSRRQRLVVEMAMAPSSGMMLLPLLSCSSRHIEVLMRTRVSSSILPFLYAFVLGLSAL
jgi:hypothetical protein